MDQIWPDMVLPSVEEVLAWADAMPNPRDRKRRDFRALLVTAYPDRVDWCDTAAEALAMAARKPYDVVFADIGDLSGFDNGSRLSMALRAAGHAAASN